MSGECDFCGNYGHVEGSCPYRWLYFVEAKENHPDEWALDTASQIGAYMSDHGYISSDVAKIIQSDIAKIIQGMLFWREE